LGQRRIGVAREDFHFRFAGKSHGMSGNGFGVRCDGFRVGWREVLASEEVRGGL
jgi:hypothetical protein